MYGYDSETLEKIMGLEQGYIVSFGLKSEIILTIKTDIALLTSLIEGCQIARIYANVSAELHSVPTTVSK